MIRAARDHHKAHVGSEYAFGNDDGQIVPPDGAIGESGIEPLLRGEVNQIAVIILLFVGFQHYIARIWIRLVHIVVEWRRSNEIGHSR